MWRSCIAARLASDGDTTKSAAGYLLKGREVVYSIFTVFDDGWWALSMVEEE
jgi:hypothetical protein